MIGSIGSIGSKGSYFFAESGPVLCPAARIPAPTVPTRACFAMLATCLDNATHLYGKPYDKSSPTIFHVLQRVG